MAEQIAFSRGAYPALAHATGTKAKDPFRQQGHGDAVLGLDVSIDGTWLVTASQDRVIRWYHLKDVEDKALSFRQKRLSFNPLDVAFGPSHDSFAVLTLGTKQSDPSILCPMTGVLHDACAGQSGTVLHVSGDWM